MTTGGVMIVLALAVVYAQGAEVTFVRCPNGSLCPDRTTCCLQSSGLYGCCPYQFALCCSDHVHCCPEGYRCNLSNGTCLQISTSVKQVQTLMTPMVLLPQQLGRKAQANEGARCPDGHSCNDGQTCCLLSSGKYGCCMYPHAVCCSDHASCCPEGYRCQVSTRTCIAGNSTLPMLKKISAVIPEEQTSVSEVQCPDGGGCEDGQTCCLLKNKSYGCCHFPNATCCADGAHCCPNGYVCDAASSTCRKEGDVLALALKKVPARRRLMPVQTPPQDTRCDDSSSCPSGMVCCLLCEKIYACCLGADSVCCPGRAYCCKHGYKCATTSPTCVPDNATQATMEEIIDPGIKLRLTTLSAKRVRCPDGNYCQDTQTCCLTTGGRFGCCPYPHAECCSNHASCCPEGYRCQLSTRSCVAGNSTMAMLKKVSTFSGLTQDIENSVSDVECPDGGSCEDGQTCCLMKNKSYGCCSYPNATCCADDAHCCPNGYVCDAASGTCRKEGDVPALALKKVPARRRLTPVQAPLQKTRCEDGSSCPSDMVCCLDSEKSYGCCLGADSVCCPGRDYCCEHGYKCATTSFSCVPDNATQVTMEEILAPGIKLRLATASVSVVECPDGGSCKDGDTCCQLEDESYGCCAYEDATCCSDDTCCPNGYVCDVATKSCRKEDVLALALKKVPARRRLMPVQATLLDTDNTCKDGHVCPGDTTCCPTPGGRYDCCPFASGVCCPDGEHCCPQSFQCDQRTGSCVRGSFYPFLKEVPMLPKFLSWLKRP